jgi:hypothetical protein
MKHLFLLACTSVIITGCGGAKETVRADGEAPYAEDLHRYESQFRPSDYDEEKGQEAIITNADPDNISVPKNDLPPLVEPPEYVSGFRVQLYSTTSIDEINARKAEAEAMFPEEWFHVVYDAPAYKLRGGNFLQRFEADRFAKQLSARGFVNAWVVPERVLKNPPAKPKPEHEGSKD